MSSLRYIGRSDGNYACRTKLWLTLVMQIKILQQLTQWTLSHPERLRDKMDEQKDTDQTTWVCLIAFQLSVGLLIDNFVPQRIEPYGWDRDDRVYYVLDDNRVYRYSEPPIMEPQPKQKKSKYYRSGRRSSKRHDANINNEKAFPDTADDEQGDDGLGGGTWECVAVSLQDVHELLRPFSKTRDENEKILKRQLEDHLIPILEKQEEAQKRKQQQREKELLNMAKMATAKRSSRLAGKAEKQKREGEEREHERHKVEAEEAERREAEAQMKLEREREFRMFARQRRLEEREARRTQHEEELAQLSEDSRKPSDSNRISERRLQAEIERNKQALQELETEEDDWIFDCVCGLYGQIDDGSHSVACEKCNVWQHSKCLGITEVEAESAEFHFLCSTCKRREEEKKWKHKPIIIKLKTRQPTGQDHFAPTKQTDSNTCDVEASTSKTSSTPPANGLRKDTELAGPGGSHQQRHAEVTEGPQSLHPRTDHEVKHFALPGSSADVNSNGYAELRAHVDRPVYACAFGHVQQTLPPLEPSSKLDAPRSPKSPGADDLSQLQRTSQVVAPASGARIETGKAAYDSNLSEALHPPADSGYDVPTEIEARQFYLYRQRLNPALPSTSGNAANGGG